jgi:endonuclease/exonuclease/phosphatase family metal-dependent hydrolase
MTRLRIASWNMHAGIGLDGRFTPERIAGVIAELDADLLALQEVGSRNAFDMLAHVELAARARGISMPTFIQHGCDFGNVVLSRLEVVSRACHLLGVGRREPRNAIDLVVDADGHSLRIMATHLGLRRMERHEQLARLGATLQRGTPMPTVLLGDFNDWRPRMPDELAPFFGGAPRAPPTFPSPCPLAALDRIWTAPASMLLELVVHRSRAARIASDHLPLVATVELPRAHRT